MEDQVLTSVTVEYDCECESEACQHAIDALRRGMQKAYDKGVEDGIRKAMSEVRDGLKQAMRGSVPKVMTSKKGKKEYSN